jgi:hypothetical protein
MYICVDSNYSSLLEWKNVKFSWQLLVYNVIAYLWS